MGIFAKIFKAVPDTDEDILEHVIGIVVVYHHSPDMPIEPFLVLMYQLGKSCFLGLLIMEGGNYAMVGIVMEH